ncbi:hypothetical protein TNCV_3013541 [Trichonephila clavipes]|nr:hypothetical protein TNCV_3013541 [Trichonephila clavipes]
MGVPIHVTGWKFLNCVIPLHPRDEGELHLHGNKIWYLKDQECSFQRIRDEMYVLSRKQQNMMKEIKKVKKEWAMDQKVILKAKLNEMKAKNDLIQRERDLMKEKNDLIQRENYILKTKEQEWKTKEQEWKTKEQEWKTKEQEWKTKEQAWKIKEQELNSKMQGMSRENKILKRVLQGKRVDRISPNPWCWNSRVKRLYRPPSALSLNSLIHSQIFQAKQT